MKRSSIALISIVVALAAFIVLSTVVSGSSGDTLLLLNWGEYIDEELLDAFEEKYDCTVSMDLADTNEIFYSKVSAGTTVYDLVIPSDYMVEKMYVNDLLEKLDFSKIPSYNPDDLRPGVKKIFSDMDKNLIDNLNNASYSYTYDYEAYGVTSSYNLKDGNEIAPNIISNYAVPYLWGTWGMMYSTEKEGLEAAVTGQANQWAAMFDRNVLPAGTKVAQYESYQHDYAIACKYLAKKQELAGLPVTYNATEELAQSELDTIRQLLKDMKYDAWGTDTIKKDITAGNIDLGFMWTGDFLYYYAENCANVAMDAYLAGDVKFEDLNSCINDLLNVTADSDGSLIKDSNDEVVLRNNRVYTAESGNEYTIGFDFYIPDDTVSFSDNIVMTKDAVHKDLAYKFIDFIVSSDVTIDTEDGYHVDDSDDADPACANPHYIYTYYVDYDATTITTYEEITGLQSDTDFSDPECINPDDYSDLGSDAYDSDLYWLIYDYAIGTAFQKYYPLNTEKGKILAMFPRKYINSINTTFNNAKI